MRPVRLPLAVLLLAATLPAACAPAPVDTVVALGDSVPAGTGCGCVPFPDLYARMLSPTTATVNLARPGLTSGQALESLHDEPARRAVGRASVVLVMAGANDVAGAVSDASSAAPIDEVRDNVSAVVREVHRVRPAAAVLVFGYWNVAADGEVARGTYDPDQITRAESLTGACDTALREAAEANGATYVDTRPLFKGDDGARDPTALLAPDGDHPNAAGQRAIALAAYAARPV